MPLENVYPEQLTPEVFAAIVIADGDSETSDPFQVEEFLSITWCLESTPTDVVGPLTLSTEFSQDGTEWFKYNQDGWDNMQLTRVQALAEPKIMFHVRALAKFARLRAEVGLPSDQTKFWTVDGLVLGIRGV